MKPPWWRSAIVYQVYPRSFADSNRDGIGDLRGIIEHLDHIADLGADAIWLSPVQPSPHHDNGYDISDYQAIDPALGTLNDFDELIAESHRLDIRLVMDLVVNHTSDEHPWFLESRSDPKSPKRDWYWWRPPRDGAQGGEQGAEPCNWGSFFSGSAWEYDPGSDEYYLHLFSKKQPDLNWENLEVRRAIYEMMGWWLDRGVDGFRMDVINLISKDPTLPDADNVSGNGYGNGFPHYNCGPRVHEYLQEMNREVFASRDGTYLKVGEMPGVTIEHAKLFTDPARRELDMVFQFDHVELDHGPQGKWSPKPLSLVELKRSFDKWQAGLADVGWNSLYWNNHDQPRVVSRFGDDTNYHYESATALATILYLQRGTPFIYQGEELGMTNTVFDSLDDFHDIETLNYVDEAIRLLHLPTEEVLRVARSASRDNARTPMQWSADPNAGFTDGDPWIPVNPRHTTINAASQRSRPGSVFHYYKKLIALRKNNPVAVDGTFELLAVEHPHLFAFERELGPERMLVMANLTSTELTMEATPGPWQTLSNSIILANYPDGSCPHRRLRPWEALVLHISDATAGT